MADLQADSTVSPPFLHLAPGLDLRHSSHSSFVHPGPPSGSTSSTHNNHDRPVLSQHRRYG
ncbi:hypothetical protein K439DRAFT_1636873 [Ramaria rubella]|nr:hypothetical protein K439DRAFT_1636873 [Ramaria rubella]